MTMQHQNASGTSTLLGGLVNNHNYPVSHDQLLYRTRPQETADRRIGAAGANMARVAPCAFGDLLRFHRSAAGLTQGELAEQSRVSVRCLSDLERGLRLRPRRWTLQALIQALQLSATDEIAFRNAARPLPFASLGPALDSAALPPTVRTVLIADIRGYTRYLVEQGNDAGAALATRFATLVRLVLEPAGGQLVELRGDEVLAVFPSVRQAVHAAVDLQQQCAAEDPVPVGVGLDVGELVEVEGGCLRGLALNLAARLCSVAEAGEVLVSDTVRHLAHKLTGLRYQDRGMLPLKGFPEPVRVFQVLADCTEVSDSGRHPELEGETYGLEPLAEVASGTARATRTCSLSATLCQAKTALAQLWRLLTLLATRGYLGDTVKREQ
jgi:class 3 adenylate cyclase